MTRLMHGFPPSANGQVTLANWRQAPFSRWAFHHVRELVPSAEIGNDPDDVHEWPIDRVEIGDIPIEADGIRPLSFDEFLVDTSTDGIVVARGGRIVFERYANGMTETTPHILMSVSKSLLGLVAGVLATSGELEPDRKVTDLVPEVGETAYKRDPAYLEAPRRVPADRGRRLSWAVGGCSRPTCPGSAGSRRGHPTSG